MKKITKKLLASVLTFIIFFAELSTLGMYGIAYATEARDTATSNQNVEFDVYFSNEKREIVSDVNTEDAKMYLNIKVKEAGYLKNGIVSFSSANFNVKTGFENEYIQEIKEDKIYLKQLDTNSNILIELPIIPKKDDIVSADNFIQESKVRIDGTYVNAKGKEIAIEKEHTVKLILNGIDFNNLDNGNQTSITRKSLKIKDNELICLTVGGYTPGKHQMEIIGIAEEVIKYNKNIKFITAGPILDEKLYKKFVNEVNRSSAKNNIIILNYIPQEEIGDFISKNCDIYLQPSIHEAGVPLTVMEALLKSKPVIMTDFMLKETFPIVDRIIGVIPPYDNILKVTTSDAYNMSLKKKDISTQQFANNILEVAKNLDKYNKENSALIRNECDLLMKSIESMKKQENSQKIA